MGIELRLGHVEDAVLVMKDLLLSHNDHLEKYFFALEKERHEREESRKDFDFKLNALIDAQIKNESEIAEVKGAISEVKESIIELRDASKSQLRRIERLEN